MELKGLLEKMQKVNASDLHLKAGSTPVFRIDGKLVSEKGESLTPENLKTMAYQIMTPSQQQTFERMKEMDFAISVRGIGRFRVNVFLQRGSIAIAMRAIPFSVRRIEELNLPLILKDIALKPRGLILCTGTTGSGKSTTLAAMIEHINENVARHVITIEDPIEYLFRDNLSIICQREVLMDTISFSIALKHILRQDPDVILIGEIRDRETMDVALKAADTGHLVLSTLHTLNATETINRIISFYPPHQHQHIRVLLATTLTGVVSLRLLPRSDGKGRIPAVEVLLSTPTIKEYLLDPVKTMLIQSAIEEGYGQYGMQTFDQSIFKLYKDGLISYDDAIQAVTNPDEFKLRLVGIEATAERGWGAFDKK
ncbi:MAG TPA: PilT/PilU family type 4a pilus ATPase [candidate division WOR-3 bacterium]|uniref:PilT/PilU family type 4a pilus ATPase n=1 Tax=candidate division WOR-3 bacterium TaxID=2052148 RepID=A0A9C9ELV2_UNCW3|nr:PilT/PilU family type 4a pilus ATPase [candidate division WOR-3 bacterium]